MSLTGLSLRLAMVVVVVGALLAGSVQPVMAATQTDLVGPVGSGKFGLSVTALPNGNIVVTDPLYDDGATADVGAVYLYNGATRALISTLKGSTANDQVGSQRVVALSNGNYVVVSPDWANGVVASAGAVTWCSGTTGCVGTVVSSTNSLVGSTANDQVGLGGVTELSNGSYMVVSPNWANGATPFVGAVTRCNGTTGCSGAVSSLNSLVGSAAFDQVGAGGLFSGGVVALSNGNYAVVSPNWANSATSSAGAVTWCPAAGCVGVVVSSTNSLVGSTDNDQVGIGGVVALSNGNYVVVSPDWANGAAAFAGAVTWCPAAGCVGVVVSSTNSLVGATANDQVGSQRVVALSNGNYVVVSPDWANGVVASAGAVTWGNGGTGVSGPITTTNSLVGSTTNDQVGSASAVALSNGNYVVASPNWANGAVASAGAVTWGNGTTGVSGPITTTNSLVGSTTNDQVGYGSLLSGGVVALSNGNYAVVSPNWANSATSSAGAVTWCPAAGCVGVVVSSTNSLVGSTDNDQVGLGDVVALSNGNYAVVSPNWTNGAAAFAGAVTWCPAAGCVGTVVSSTNSLVGATANDQVGSAGAVALSNGNYVVVSPDWANGVVASAGAVTWCSGTTGCVGTVVSSTNSLVGSTANDQVGLGGVTELSNGSYMVVSIKWDKGANTDVGAVTWGSATGLSGPITTTNSVLGSASNGGSSMVFAYDAVHNQLVVGRPADNVVTLFSTLFNVYLPLISR